MRDRVGQNLSALQEGITGVRVIQAYAREDEQIRRFDEHEPGAVRRPHATRSAISVWYFPLVEWRRRGRRRRRRRRRRLARAPGRPSRSAPSPPSCCYLTNLFEPVQQLSAAVQHACSRPAPRCRSCTTCSTPSRTIGEQPGAVDLPDTGAVEVDGVSFGYAGGARPALHDVSLTIAPGERLALVGPTGAGKSTLAKLIARLYDPTEGTVRFGGLDLRRATLASLRERIVVVPQEGFLFSGTIRDNVRVGRPEATDDEIDAALAAIGVLERFAALPRGLDTEVRERGSRLSAGERQLVSLARAALADPAVLVLDEATSNLDPGTEAAVEAAMERLMEGRTVDRGRPPPLDRRSGRTASPSSTTAAWSSWAPTTS